jgi:hypothetical protein
MVGDEAAKFADAKYLLNLGLVETQEGLQQIIEIFQSIELPQWMDIVVASHGNKRRANETGGCSKRRPVIKNNIKLSYQNNIFPRKKQPHDRCDRSIDVVRGGWRIVVVGRGVSIPSQKRPRISAYRPVGDLILLHFTDYIGKLSIHIDVDVRRLCAGLIFTLIFSCLVPQR